MFTKVWNMAGYDDYYYLKQAIIAGDLEKIKQHLEQVDEARLNDPNAESLLALAAQHHEGKPRAQIIQALSKKIDISVTHTNTAPNIYYILELSEFKIKQGILNKKDISPEVLLNDPEFDKHIATYVQIQKDKDQKDKDYLGLFETAMNNGQLGKVIGLYNSLIRYIIEVPDEIKSNITKNIIDFYFEAPEFFEEFIKTTDKTIPITTSRFKELCRRPNVDLMRLMQFDSIRNYDNLLVDILESEQSSELIGSILASQPQPSTIQLQNVLNTLLDQQELDLNNIKLILTHIKSTRQEEKFSLDNIDDMALLNKLFTSMDQNSETAIEVVTLMLQTRMLSPFTEVRKSNGGLWRLAGMAAESKVSLLEKAIELQATEMIVACISPKMGSTQPLMSLFELPTEKKKECFEKANFSYMQKLALIQYSIINNHGIEGLNIESSNIRFGEAEVKSWIDNKIIPELKYLELMHNISLATRVALLHLAIEKNDLQVATLLFDDKQFNEQQKLLEMEGGNVETPYAHAERLGNAEISKYLKDKGANINVEIKYEKRAAGWVYGEWISEEINHPIKKAFLDKEVEKFKELYQAAIFNYEAVKESVLALAIELNVLEDFLAQKKTLFNEEQYLAALKQYSHNMEAVKLLLAQYPESKPALPDNLLQSIFDAKDFKAMELLLKTGMVPSNSMIITEKGIILHAYQYLLPILGQLEDKEPLHAFLANLNITQKFNNAETKAMLDLLKTADFHTFEILMNTATQNLDAVLGQYEQNQRENIFKRFSQLLFVELVLDKDSEQKLQYLHNYGVEQVKGINLHTLFINDFERFKWLVENRIAHEDDIKKMNEQLTSARLLASADKLEFLATNQLINEKTTKALQSLDVLSMTSHPAFKVLVQYQLVNLAFTDDTKTKIRTDREGNNILHLISIMNNEQLLNQWLKHKAVGQVINQPNLRGMTPVDYLVMLGGSEKNLRSIIMHEDFNFTHPAATLLLAYQSGNKELTSVLLHSAKFSIHKAAAIRSTFEYAIENNDINMIEQIVVDVIDAKGNDILKSEMLAVFNAYQQLKEQEHEKRKTIEHMILKIAEAIPAIDLNAQSFLSGGSDSGPTFLNIICDYGAYEVLNKLLDVKGLDINKAGKDKENILPAPVLTFYNKYLAQGKNPKMLEALDKMIHYENIDINATIPGGDTLLGMACKAGDMEVVYKLVVGVKTVNKEARNDFQQTPLMLAVSSGNKELVEFLLQNEEFKKHINDVDIADPTSKQPNNNALLYAYATGEKEIIALLEQNGAVVDNTLKSKRTILMAAVCSNNKELIQKTLKNSDLDAKDIDGNTALHTAIFAKNSLGIAELINEIPKLNPDIQNNSGMTPLMLAVTMGDIATVQQLVAQGADINIADSEGNTALHYACSLANKEMVELLCRPGIEHRPNKHGATPFMLSMVARASYVQEEGINNKDEWFINSQEISNILLSSGANPYTTSEDIPFWEQIQKDLIKYTTLRVAIEIVSAKIGFSSRMGHFSNAINFSYNIQDRVNNSVNRTVTDYFNRGTERDQGIDYTDRLLVASYKISTFGFVSSNIPDMNNAIDKYKNIDKAVVFQDGKLQGLQIENVLQNERFHQQLGHQYYQLRSKLENEWMLPWTRSGFNNMLQQIVAADETLLVVPKSYNDGEKTTTFSNGCPQLAAALRDPDRTINTILRTKNEELREKMKTLVNDIINDNIVTSVEEKYNALNFRVKLKQLELDNKAPTIGRRIKNYFTGTLKEESIKELNRENYDGLKISADKWKKEVEVAKSITVEQEKVNAQPSVFEKTLSQIAYLTGKNEGEVVSAIANVAATTSGAAAGLANMAAQYPQHAAVMLNMAPIAISAVTIAAPIVAMGAVGAAVLMGGVKAVQYAISGVMGYVKTSVPPATLEEHIQLKDNAKFSEFISKEKEKLQGIDKQELEKSGILKLEMPQLTLGI